MNLLRFQNFLSFSSKNVAIPENFVRFLTVSQTATGSSNSHKDVIRELRRRTGYSFSHIKKALEKHDWDISSSENWLRAEAKRLGWERATGLASRVSRQGLLGVLETEKAITMVELNCETDFVAKNKRFHNLLSSICHSVDKNNSLHCSPLNKHRWAELDALLVGSSKCFGRDVKVSDLIASEIGHIGENIQLRRGLYWPKPASHSDNTAVAFMTHPVSTIPAVVDTELGPLNVGKYAAVVEARRSSGSIGEDVEKLSLQAACQQLSQHVIGMNPDKIFPEKKAANDTSDAEETSATEDNQRDERAFVNQAFILDEDITVGEFLEEQLLEITDFVRYEVGEDVSS